MQGIIDIDQLRDISSWNSDIFANYSGSDRKDGVISPTGEKYLIKYAEKHTRKNDLDTSYVNNVLSEYLSSHILGICGYDVHETFVATRNGELLVACKNFTSDNRILIEFGIFLHKHYDSGEIGRIPSLDQIIYVLENDPVLSRQKKELLDYYARQFVGDALTGNFDRHMGSFGYLVGKDGSVNPAPIYDNGSTLFPALSEKGIFPKAALRIKDQKVSYKELLSSGYEETFTRAVVDIVPRISGSLDQINEFISSQSFLSETRRRFYKTVINERFNKILLPAYERCVKQEFDERAYENISKGISYSESDFEKEAIGKSERMM